MYSLDLEMAQKLPIAVSSDKTPLTVSYNVMFVSIKSSCNGLINTLLTVNGIHVQDAYLNSWVTIHSIFCEVRLYNPFVAVVRQANIRLIKAGLKLVGAMCSCGSDVASVLIVSC